MLPPFLSPVPCYFTLTDAISPDLEFLGNAHDSNSQALKTTKRPSAACRFLRQTSGRPFSFPTCSHWWLCLRCLSREHLSREFRPKMKSPDNRENYIVNLFSVSAISFSISGRILSLYFDKSAFRKHDNITGTYCGFAEPICARAFMHCLAVIGFSSVICARKSEIIKSKRFSSSH